MKNEIINKLNELFEIKTNRLRKINKSVCKTSNAIDKIQADNIIIVNNIKCYKCDEEQEDTQRFCVNCNTCLT
jgi:hypothetical protein